jgi:hypothetical protein
MICEFLLLYSSVYLVFLSFKECCRYAEDGEDDEKRCIRVPYQDVKIPSYGGEECCICLETFEKTTPVCVFPCNHFVCSGCFDLWVDEVDEKENVRLRCPLCNTVV